MTQPTHSTSGQNFIVYKSSAGSGKTYTLVKEYLRIILENPSRIRNILAITFTNAAAAEMKERIIDALGSLAALHNRNNHTQPDKAILLLNTLSSELNLLKSEIIQNARLALSLILHNYGDFSVSTIDSFAHRIIRSFAFDLRLPTNFDVELDKDQMLGQAIDLMVSKAGNDPALTSLLVEYIESRTDEDKSLYIEGDMARLAQTLMDEKGNYYIGRLKNLTLHDFSEIHRKLTLSIKNFETSVKDIALAARKLIDSHNISDECFSRGKNGIGAYFRNLANGNIEAKIAPNSYVVTTITENKWLATKVEKATAADIESIKDQLADYYHQIQNLAQQQLSFYKIHIMVRKNLFPMAVLCELEKVIDQIKSEHSLLHISDFNKKISEIVSVESAPFIYERIGERYHHYMIDEFQDTSGLQWQNLLPLIDNALASGYINLVVGDGKQAIYRWRNGDVEQFAMLPNLSQGIKAEARNNWEQTLIRSYKELSLDSNWRSLPQVIDFNNSFFQYIKTLLPDDLAKIYQGHTQKKHPEKTGGYVQIDFTGASADATHSYQEQTYSRIVEIITQLRQNNHPLNDITILCRSNTEASATARFLLSQGLNVISSESLLLNQSTKVNFILSALKLINHSDDQVSMAEFISFLVKNSYLSDDLHQTLVRICGNRGNESDHLLEDLLQQNGITFSFSQCRHLGIYEMGEMILRCFFREKQPDPFIAFFMDVLYEYSNRFISSLPDFLEWWQENSHKYSVVVPEGVDAVQVMTIHKSKGLQFPVVIYPFVDKDFSRPGKEGEWVELPDMDETHPLNIAWLSITSAMEGTPYEPLWIREKGRTLLDIFNIMYVAFTRAIEKLFILSKYPDSGKFSDKNLAGFLQKFLEMEGMWDESLRSFPFGENSIKPSNDTALPVTDEAGKMNQYISVPWAGRISVRSRQLEVIPDAAPGSQRGTRIHEIMEKIHTPGDIDTVLQQFLQTGQISQDEYVSYGEKIKGILSHTLISKWYTSLVRGRNECGMYDEKGNFYRADRVIVEGNMAVIIDYKTGQPQSHHKRQINLYAGIIRQMGYTNIYTYLAYIDLLHVEEVLCTETSDEEIFD